MCLYTLLICVSVFMDVGVTVFLCGSEDDFQESILSSDYVGPGIKLQSLGLVASVFTPWVSHLAGPARTFDFWFLHMHLGIQLFRQVTLERRILFLSISGEVPRAPRADWTSRLSAVNHSQCAALLLAVHYLLV